MTNAEQRRSERMHKRAAELQSQACDLHAQAERLPECEEKRSLTMAYHFTIGKACAFDEACQIALDVDLDGWGIR